MVGYDEEKRAGVGDGSPVMKDRPNRPYSADGITGRGFAPVLSGYRLNTMPLITGEYRNAKADRQRATAGVSTPVGIVARIDRRRPQMVRKAIERP